MPRKRMIDPGFWRDEKLAECTHIERLLFIGLWTFAEDHGVGRANPKLIKADIFPYDTLRDSDLDKSLAHLASLGLITLYEIDTQRYYFVNNFERHQVINRPSKCILPTPNDQFSNTHGVLTEYSRSTHSPIEDKRIEENILPGANAPDRNSAPIFELPLNDDTLYPLYDQDISLYSNLYPAVNINQQLRAMIGWCDGNPKKRKTRAGIKRFINAWLAKEQDRGGSIPAKQEQKWGFGD